MSDTSIVRVHQHADRVETCESNCMGRSRGGLTPKIHAVVDAKGRPICLALNAGQHHDSLRACDLLTELRSNGMLLADRAYDPDAIRDLARDRGAWAKIPPRGKRRKPICFSPRLYRDRNRVEGFFNRIEHCRRIAIRYDKQGEDLQAFRRLAAIRLWLGACESTP